MDSQTLFTLSFGVMFASAFCPLFNPFWDRMQESQRSKAEATLILEISEQNLQEASRKAHISLQGFLYAPHPVAEKDLDKVKHDIAEAVAYFAVYEEMYRSSPVKTEFEKSNVEFFLFALSSLYVEQFEATMEKTIAGIKEAVFFELLRIDMSSGISANNTITNPAEDFFKEHYSVPGHSDNKSF